MGRVSQKPMHMPANLVLIFKGDNTREAFHPVLMGSLVDLSIHAIEIASELLGMPMMIPATKVGPDAIGEVPGDSNVLCVGKGIEPA